MQFGATAEAATADAPPAVESTEIVAAPSDTPQVLDESGATVADVALPAAADESESALAVSDEATADSAVAAPEVAAAPELVEVWRPGGRSDERRPRHDRNRPRHQDRPRPQEGAQPVAAEGEAGEGAKRERHGRGRRERNKEFAKTPQRCAGRGRKRSRCRRCRAGGPPREDQGRPPRERFQGKGRDGRDKGKFAGKPKGDRDGGRSSGGPSHRQYATSAPPRERERPVDPNSPFAKLAALKEQLTAGRKD